MSKESGEKARGKEAGKTAITAGSEPELSRQVGARAARKLKARRRGTQTVWSGLGMIGLVGWSVVVPTLAGTEDAGPVGGAGVLAAVDRFGVGPRKRSSDEKIAGIERASLVCCHQAVTSADRASTKMPTRSR